MITSLDYGKQVSPPEIILANTAKALESYQAKAQILNEDLVKKDESPLGAGRSS